ncbi:membrane-targeted effector domain-containing toxin [Pseudomonas sp. MM213]|uniref:membrane-targeted effector domain-containing toxin n=1 Tax=Pseudomonas sp. MM213 TaxID=2866807 RepID=UPI001CF52B3D|nr:membrane-targeted effector domain-containing toxin [Pseudomonas sp. MM213]UCP09294.1 membrane-targeted effector domain-containing toxin [Pseudomonas sp. MM213]
MSTEQNTPVSSNAADQETLRLIAPVVVTACPGLQEEAHAVASEILQKHGITHLDPDQVWWHRFNNVSASSTKAFLGWEHAPKPSESLTLTQLVIHRYRVTDQDDALELDSNGGFYTADANASIYNETNEVRMYPRQVLADLWEKNLSQRYLDKLNAFWASHFDDYRALAKCNYLSKAVEARQSGQLEEEDFQTVIRAVIGGASWPITLATLKAQTATPADLRVCALDVAGHVATDILRIVEPNGRQITYVPGAAEPFHVHPTLTDMHWWMLLQMNEEHPRTEFMTHFPLSVRKEVHDNITPLMNQLVGTWGKYDHHLINQKDITISGDVFTWQSRAVQHTMLEEADLTLVSNGQMRKQLWLGYLTAALHVFGPLAVLGWPIALPVIGASIAAMGLNTDKAVNGKTAAERKAGIIGTVLDGINVLFNLPLLKEVSVLDETGAAAEAAEAAEMADLNKTLDPEETVGTQEPQAPGESEEVTLQPGELPGVPDETAQAFDVPEHWQSNEILESYPMATSGKFQGVYTLDSQPSNAILINEQAYFVRFEADANGGGTWAIIDPQNPNAFTGSIPVRLNAQGEWELAPKSGLMGGGKGPSKLVPGPSRPAAPLPPKVNDHAHLTRYDAPNGRSLNFLALGKQETHIKVVNMPGGQIRGVSPYEEYVAGRRTALARDAIAFQKPKDFFASLPPRPVQPVITPSTTVTELIEKVFDASPGLVVGESQDRIASMRFLIENMPTLARKGVKTIYMHRLLNDFNQVDLNNFAETGNMHGMLEMYLKKLPGDPAGQFTPLEVVKTAQQNGIQIQATDCLASYRYEDSTMTLRAQQSFKTYLTHTIMQATQARNGGGKWLVLTDQESTNTFRGMAGISETEGGIGLRIEEVQPDQRLHLDIDHGIEVGHEIAGGTGPMHGNTDTLYADISLQMPTPFIQRTPEQINQLLFRQGMFTIERSEDTFSLIHRSRTGQIVRTTIERTMDSGFRINRPAWAGVHRITYANLISLAHALNRMGLTLQGRLPAVTA